MVNSNLVQSLKLEHLVSHNKQYHKKILHWEII